MTIPPSYLLSLHILSDTHPQPVKVVSSDTNKIPVVAVFNLGRLPLAACEHVETFLAMQPAVIAGKIKADVVAVCALVKYQCGLSNVGKSGVGSVCGCS